MIADRGYSQGEIDCAMILMFEDAVFQRRADFDIGILDQGAIKVLYANLRKLGWSIEFTDK